jgi:hypothetical protein
MPEQLPLLDLGVHSSLQNCGRCVSVEEDDDFAQMGCRRTTQTLGQL